MRRIPGDQRRQQEFDGPAELARFFRAGHLAVMPKRADDRAAVLAYVASRFERGRDYAEEEVNRALLAIDSDYASLRRALVDAGLLTRASGTYRRV